MDIQKLLGISTSSSLSTKHNNDASSGTNCTGQIIQYPSSTIVQAELWQSANRKMHQPCMNETITKSTIKSDIGDLPQLGRLLDFSERTSRNAKNPESSTRCCSASQSTDEQSTIVSSPLPSWNSAFIVPVNSSKPDKETFKSSQSFIPINTQLPVDDLGTATMQNMQVKNQNFSKKWTEMASPEAVWTAPLHKVSSRRTTCLLRAWLREHKANPYPTKGEKIMLAVITEMSLTQISTWFANARRRLKKENQLCWNKRGRPPNDAGLKRAQLQQLATSVPSTGLRVPQAEQNAVANRDYSAKCTSQPNDTRLTDKDVSFLINQCDADSMSKFIQGWHDTGLDLQTPFTNYQNMGSNPNRNLFSPRVMTDRHEKSDLIRVSKQVPDQIGRFAIERQQSFQCIPNPLFLPHPKMLWDDNWSNYASESLIPAVHANSNCNEGIFQRLYKIFFNHYYKNDHLITVPNFPCESAIDTTQLYNHPIDINKIVLASSSCATQPDGLENSCLPKVSSHTGSPQAQ